MLRRRKARVLVSIAAACTAAIAIYLLLCPLVAMPLYNRLIFEPDFDGNFTPGAIGGYPLRTYWIRESNGQKLFGWYVENPQATKTVLLSHGNGGDLTDRVELISKLVHAGASVFAYDYEGFGLSSGRPTLDSICADGLAAYDFLNRNLHVDSRRIVLFGESLGTGVTCQIAEQRQSNGLILQSPFTSLPDVARYRACFINLYPLALFPKQRLDSTELLDGRHPRVLIVHGQRDDTVPFLFGRQLFDHASQPKQLVVLPDGEHENMTRVDSVIYDSALKRFLSAG